MSSNRRYLSIVDNGFLITETEDSPKHIGSLLIYRKPEGADDNFVHALYKKWLTVKEAYPPYNLKLNITNPLTPFYTEDPDFDPVDHVEYLKMPEGSSREKLYAKVSELHESLTDRSLPLWRCYVIDGLSDNRFAVYFRGHHCMVDGISAGKIMMEFHAKDAETLDLPPFWAMPDNPYNKKSSRKKPSMIDRLKNMATSNVKTAVGISRISTQLCLEAAGLTKNAISLPFTSSKSALTGSITYKRSFSTASLPMDRVSNLQKISRNTLNHVALTCLDGAIHRYLDHIGRPLDEPLTITMPVSLRREDAKVGGNQIGLVATKLADRTDDPVIRLREIGVSLQSIRHQIDTSPAASIQAYSLLTNGFSQLMESAKAAQFIPALSHTIVSNVPGPKQTLYMEGAALEEWYPVSTLGPGHRLNVTMFSYDGQLHFGLIASKDYLPDLNVLGGYIYEAFEELEAVLQSPDMGTSLLEAKRQHRRAETQ
ncbi:wax ester/triacylglycerol synthase family O-acyltransferase [Litoribrevibacter euphylliae]|uniref:diacylglycerol O-acyltransferase n=1 Tax=Litoribrevibacter euphylliae TaxID=1834034 RepID=A0ABV7HJ35_9GAMM